ncbi:MAG: gamma-glutamyl-gamma-aminobutyrate hydrolase family protein [Actinomycetes bacterium]
MTTIDVSRSLARTVLIPARCVGGGVGIQATYLDALRACGLTALVVTDAQTGRELLGRVGGLLLPGGPDVDPERYGASRHPATVSEPGLDELEFGLLEQALRDDRPVMAICRGLQVLNVALGGTLVQDLPSQRPSATVHVGHMAPAGHPVDAWHPVRLDPCSRVGRVLGDELDVTSYHHQAVAALAPGLVATGWSPDGLVEAVEAVDRGFVLGVQFHPERMADLGRERLFTAFADAIETTSGARAGAGAGAGAGAA